MRDGGPFCAEFHAPFRDKVGKDWIDEGSYPLYYLRNSNVAQRGHFSSGHPIVEEGGNIRVREVRLNVDNPDPWALGRGV